MSQDAQFLAMLDQAWTDPLSQSCFRRVEQNEWVRRWGWKADRIRATIRGLGSIVINCEVLTPEEPGSPLDFHYVAMANLGHVMGSSQGSLKLPRREQQYREKVDEIIKTTPFVIEWFRTFETPRQCLENMITEHVNPLAPAVAYCRNYLLRIAEHIPTACCSIITERTYSSDDARLLFDVRCQR